MGVKKKDDELFEVVALSVAAQRDYVASVVVVTGMVDVSDLAVVIRAVVVVFVASLGSMAVVNVVVVVTGVCFFVKEG